MVIRTELDQILSRNPEHFNRLIDSIRARGYIGKMIYSAAFSSELDTAKITQMNRLKLDDDGVDLYTNLHKQYSRKIGSRKLIDNKGKIRDETYIINEGPYEFMYYFDRIFAKTNRPVIFTEVGFRSIEHGNRWPYYNFDTAGACDYYVQDLCYKNWLEALKIASAHGYHIDGSIFWITDDADFVNSIFHADSTGFSPFGKPAADALREYNNEINSAKK